MSLNIIFLLAGFFIVAVSISKLAVQFQRIKLPVVSGYIFLGILTGPDILNIISRQAIIDLNFISDISIPFIAFTAGSELYLSELRSRMKSIRWITFSHAILIILICSFAIYQLSDYIPFMQALPSKIRLAIAVLAGTIFITRSPAAIAVVNEMRARGPYTQTVLGVTFIKDVLVILLFSIFFAIANMLIKNVAFNINLILTFVGEIVLSLLFGYGLGKFIPLLMMIKVNRNIKAGLLLLTGWGIHLLSNLIRETSVVHLPFEIFPSSLLICIIAGFIVTNYSQYRTEFIKIIKDTSLFVFVAFFSYIGASISLNIVLESWGIALIIFGVRLVSLFISTAVGAKIAGDSTKFSLIAGLGFITQTGVAIGLISIVSNEFSDWGAQFASIFMTVVFLSEIVGPPCLKLAITLMGEAHKKAVPLPFDGIRNVVIFGFDGQSLALAHQLKHQGWNVKLITTRSDYDSLTTNSLTIIKVETYKEEFFKTIGIEGSDVIVAMESDDLNYQICEIAYEYLGTKNLIVKLNNRDNFNRFSGFNARIIEQSTSFIRLLESFIRAPQATSLILGLEENFDTVDIEVCNRDMQGLYLRDLRLPDDVLILSIKRGDQTFLSHGYSRFRLGDIVTLVGSFKSITEVKTKLLDTKPKTNDD